MGAGCLLEPSLVIDALYISAVVLLVYLVLFMLGIDSYLPTREEYLLFFLFNPLSG